MASNVSSSNATNPTDTALPDSLSGAPTSQPKPSTSQSLPPNNDAAMAAAERDPKASNNPVKQGSGGVSAGKGIDDARGGGSGEQKGLGDKIKDKLT